MKLRRYPIILLALLISIGCASTSKLQSDSIEKYEIRIYEVFGMDCPGCHDGVEKLVNKVPGVHDSEAYWEKARLEVTVKTGSELPDEAIFDAVKKANFTPGKRIE